MELQEEKTATDKLIEFVSPYIGSLFPGCIMGCATSTKSFAFAVGTQDFKVRMHTNNMFDIASVTKAFLHILTLKLIPFNKLDQKIVEVFPMEGKYRNRITVRHLLSFAVEYNDNIRLSEITDRATLFDTVTKGDLPFPPGLSFRYTNRSSMLLTFFLEAEFGMPIDQLLQKYLFDDLDMTNTWFSNNSYHRIGASQFVPTERGLNRGIVQDESTRLWHQPTGSAGLFSSIRDLLKLGQSFLGEGTYLPREVIKQMPLSQFGSNSSEHFGLGLGLRHQNECDLCDENGLPMIVLKKNGFSGIHFCVMPEDDFCFVVFGNVCYPERPSLEKQNEFTRFHKNVLRHLYENRNALLV